MAPAFKRQVISVSVTSAWSTTPGQPEQLYRQKLYLEKQKEILVLKFVLIFKIASRLLWWHKLTSRKPPFIQILQYIGIKTESHLT